ncbi:MAG TPA: MFS transporter, partial [Desulfopila sp.]|nr:MFS transporter [Desulfopila sp.]
MNTNERAILRVTCYGHFLSHFNMLVFPAILLPLSQQFQLDMVETLSLSFWMYLLFGVSALPWGMVADRLGARKMLVLYHLGAGVCGLLAAFSSDDPLRFSFALTGIGLFSGIYHPVGLGWIARDVRNTSIGMAYNGMFGNLGLAMAPLLAGIVNLVWGVAAVYVVVGIVNLGGLSLLMSTRKNGDIPFAPPKKVEASRSLLPFAILLAAMMLGGVVYRGTSVTLPAYFELNNRDLFLWIEQMFGGIGTENVVATGITSMIYLVGMIGQYAG